MISRIDDQISPAPSLLIMDIYDTHKRSDAHISEESIRNGHSPDLSDSRQPLRFSSIGECKLVKRGERGEKLYTRGSNSNRPSYQAIVEMASFKFDTQKIRRSLTPMATEFIAKIDIHDCMRLRW